MRSERWKGEGGIRGEGWWRGGIELASLTSVLASSGPILPPSLDLTELRRESSCLGLGLGLGLWLGLGLGFGFGFGFEFGFGFGLGLEARELLLRLHDGICLGVVRDAVDGVDGRDDQHLIWVRVRVSGWPAETIHTPACACACMHAWHVHVHVACMHVHVCMLHLHVHVYMCMHMCMLYACAPACPLA